MNFNHPNITLIFGSPGSGKTAVAKYMVRQRALAKTFERIFILTTSKFTGEYDFVDEKYVIAGNFNEAAASIMALQQDRVPCLLLMDDISGIVKFNQDPWNALFTTCRKTNITIIANIHYANLFSTTIREAADNAVMFFQTTRKAIEALCGCYGQNFENWKHFKEFLNQETQAEDESKKHHFVYWSKVPASEEARFQTMKIPWPIPDFHIQVDDSSEEESEGEEGAEEGQESEGEEKEGMEASDSSSDDSGSEGDL
jgi:hypothetical protein